VPIIFLSALDAIAERVAGLDLGADDYLPKPFSPKELEARISTILRRMGRGAATSEPRELPVGSGVLRVGDLVVDTNRRQVTREGQRIPLTYTEFSLLEVLARNAGHLVSKEDISQQAFGRPLARFDRRIDVHISSIRQKLGLRQDGEPWITSVRGMGYQLLEDG
jgi:DNA-binding response OmpR family regulator